LAGKFFRCYAKVSINNKYCLKLDIKKYFPSIDHNILKKTLEKYIKDRKILNIFDLIIDGSSNSTEITKYYPQDDLLTPLVRKKGIPIGNLTSQIFANLYLNNLDHIIKEKLKVQTYLRYVDDLFLLGNDKKLLWQYADSIEYELFNLRLMLHPKKRQIYQTKDGVDVLGYRVFPEYRLLRNDNGYRFKRKLKKYARKYSEGKAQWKEFNPSVQSWLGHAKHADTFGLRRNIFSSTIFIRG